MSRMYMLAVVVVAAVLSGGCKKEKEPEKVVVQMEKVGTDNLEIYGEYVGRIRARRFVEVRARVEGYLEKMLFEEGKRVQQNQPLFMINRAQYKARADKADAQLKKDLAQEAKAARDVERLRPLYEQKAASQLDLDNAVAAYESAKASVAMSRADLAQANLELGYTTVKSPVSGYISERYVDIGTLVGPGAKSLLATIVDSDTVLVDFSLTAQDYLRSLQRNVKLGEKTCRVPGSRISPLPWPTTPFTPSGDWLILRSRRWTPKPELSVSGRSCRIRSASCFRDSLPK